METKQTKIQCESNDELFQQLLEKLQQINSQPATSIHLLLQTYDYLIYFAKMRVLSEAQCQLLVESFARYIIPRLLKEKHYKTLSTYEEKLKEALSQQGQAAESARGKFHDLILERSPQCVGVSVDLPNLEQASLSIETAEEFERRYRDIESALEGESALTQSEANLQRMFRALEMLIHLCLIKHQNITYAKNCEQIARAIQLNCIGLSLAEKNNITVHYERFALLMDICFAHYFSLHTADALEKRHTCLLGLQTNDVGKKTASLTRICCTANFLVLHVELLLIFKDKPTDIDFNVIYIIEKAKRLYQKVIERVLSNKSFYELGMQSLTELTKILHWQITREHIEPLSSASPSPLLSWRKHRETLKDLRTPLKADLENRPIGDTFDIVQQYNRGLKNFFTTLFQDCIDFIGGNLPVGYVFLILGSLARGEACPYSDIEFAFLVEDNSINNKVHTEMVLRLFEMLVFSIGETPFKNIHLQHLLPEGLRFDDRYVPLKNLSTEWHPQFWGTINTLLSDFHDNVIGNMMQDADLLITNSKDQKLYEDFKKALAEKLKQENKKFADLLIKTNKSAFTPYLETTGKISIKTALLELPVLLLSILSIRYGIRASSSIERLEKIQAVGGIHPFIAKIIRLHLAFSLHIRYLAHLHYGQEEEILFLQRPSIDEKSPSFFLPSSFDALLKGLRQSLLPLLCKSFEAPENLKDLHRQDYQAIIPVLSALGDTYFQAAIENKDNAIQQQYWETAFSYYNLMLNLCPAQDEAEKSTQNHLQERIRKLYKEEIIPQWFKESMISCFTRLLEGKTDIVWSKLYLIWCKGTGRDNWPPFPAWNTKVPAAIAQNVRLILMATCLMTDKPRVEHLLLQCYILLSMQIYRLIFSEELAIWHQLSIKNYPWLALPDKDGKTLTRESDKARWQRTLHGLIETYREEITEIEIYKKNNRLCVEWAEDDKVIKGLLAVNVQKQWETTCSEAEKNRHYKSFYDLGSPTRALLQCEDQTVISATLYPEMLGMQLAINRLTQYLTGIDLQITLCRFTPLGEKTVLPYPVLLSEHIKSKTLKQHLDETHSLKEIDEYLDPFYFTLKVLETLIIAPRGLKFENLSAQIWKNPEGKVGYRLITLYSKYGFNFNIPLKSPVFCFKQMQRPFHPEAIKLFLTLDPYTILENWVAELQQYYQTAIGTTQKPGLFAQEMRVRLMCKEGSCTIPIVFERHTMICLADRMQRLITALRDELIPVKTPLELLQRLEPHLADHYEKIHQSFYETPEQRFNYLLNVKFSIDIPQYINAPLQTPQNIIDEELPFIKQSKDIKGIRKAFMQGQLDEFQNALPCVKQQILNQVDFNAINFSAANPKLRRQSFEKEVLSCLQKTSPLETITLQNCLALSLKILTTLLQNNKALRVLNLRGCQNLKGNIGALLTNCQNLVIIDLSDTKIEYIDNNTSVVTQAIRGLGVDIYPIEPIELPRLKHLLVNNCQNLLDISITNDSLTHFYALRCMKLSKLEGSFLKSKKIQRVCLDETVIYKKLINQCPVFLGFQWNDYQMDVIGEAIKKLCGIFNTITIDCTQFPSEHRQQLIEQTDQLLKKFIPYRKAFLELRKALSEILNNSAFLYAKPEALSVLETLKSPAEKLLPQAGLFLELKTSKKDIMDDIKALIAALKNREKETRKEASNALGGLGQILVQRINNLFTTFRASIKTPPILWKFFAAKTSLHVFELEQTLFDIGCHILEYLALEDKKNFACISKSTFSFFQQASAIKAQNCLPLCWQAESVDNTNDPDISLENTPTIRNPYSFF